MLMPKEPTWWGWVITVGLLALGLAGQPWFFVWAMAFSLAQSIYFISKMRSLKPYTVQIRLAYSGLLGVCSLPFLRWLYWLPTLGTTALVLFGYCLMAQVLSLLPWNRYEPLTLSLLRRTFCSTPVIGRADHGLPAVGCPGGVCELEGRFAAATNQPGEPNLKPQPYEP